MGKSIKELFYGSFSRPDASGVRGNGVGKKSQQIGDDEFPYGKGDPSYGQPMAYDRGSAGHGSHQNVPTPKGIADDDTRWDEAVGVPFNVAMASKGGNMMGQQTAGINGGNWAGRPKGGCWDNEMPEDQLDAAGDEKVKLSDLYVDSVKKDRND